MKVARHPLLPFILLLTVAIGVVGVWFSGPYYLYFLDEILPFNPRADVQMFSGAWNPLFNGGDPMPYSLTLLPTFYYYSALQVLGLPIWSSEFLFYVACLFFGMAGVCRAAQLVLVKGLGARWVPVLAGLVYAFNPITMIIGFPNGGPLGLLLFASLPWVYAYYRIGLGKASGDLGYPFRETVLASLALAIVFGTNVPSNLGAFAIILPLAIASFFRRSSNVTRGSWHRITTFAIGVPLLAIALGGWWEIPLIGYVLHPDTSAVGNFFQTSLNLSTWQGGTAPSTTLAVLTLNGFPNWGWQSINTLYTGSSPLMLLAIPFLLVCFGGVLWATNRSVRAEWMFHSAILLILVLIVTGVNSPIASAWEVLLQNPILGQILRFPWFALWTPLLLYFALLFAISFQVLWKQFRRLQGQALSKDSLSGRSKPSLLGVLVSRDKVRVRWKRSRNGVYSAAGLMFLAGATVLIIVVYPAPMWDGSFIPNSPTSERVDVPQYVEQAASFISDNSDGHETLIFPPGECLDLSNWSRGYLGQSIVGLLAGTRTIYSSCRNAGGVQEAVQLAYGTASSNLTGSNYSQLLSILDVKYIVLRWDAGGPFGTTYPSPDPSQINRFLRSQPNIVFIRNFGNYSIFQNLRTPETVFASTDSVSNGSLWSYRNVTDLYYNRSVQTIGPESFANVFPRSTPEGLAYLAPLTNYTGGPLIAANSVPLNVNTSIYSTLEISLTVSTGTAVTVMASSRTAFPEGYGFWSGDPIPLFSSTGVDSALGGDWPNYYSPSSPTTLTFSLRDLVYTDALYPPGRPISPLNYLLFVIWPVENGTPQSYLTRENWSPAVTLHWIEVGGSSLVLTLSNFGPSSKSSTNLSTESLNLTHEYFSNLNSTGPSPYNSTLDWTSSSKGGYVATYNRSLGSYAVLLNTKPLAINTSKYPFLSLEFQLPSNMSVEVLASSLPVLNGSSLWDQRLVPIAANNGRLFQLSNVWSNWYTSTNASSAIFNLQSLQISDDFYPTGSVLNPLNYLALIIYPTTNDTPVFGPIQPSVTPSIQILSIASFQVASNVPTLEGVDHYVMFNSSDSIISSFANYSKSPSNSEPILDLTQASSTEYTIEGVLRSSGGFYITLTENFDPGWSLLVNGVSVPSVNHFESDYYANSWYLPPGVVALNSTFTLTILFSPEELVKLGSYVTGLGVAATGLLILVPWLSRTRRRNATHALAPSCNTEKSPSPYAQS